MNKETKNPEEPQTLKLNDKEYKLESVTEAGKQIIQSIKLIEDKIREEELVLSIFGEAKNSMVMKLSQESVNFEEVQEVQEVQD